MIIIIEGSYTKVLNGTKYSTIEGISIIRKLMTLWIRHGICHKFCINRAEMTSYITEFYCSLGKDYLRKKGVKKLT